MKIMILTYAPSNNFGAYMQAFALGEFLRNMGHEVLTFRRNLMFYQLPEEALGNPHYLKRTSGYIAFERKHMSYTPLVKTAAEYKRVSKDADLIITGSDQVWSRRHTGTSLERFCLDFARGSKAVVASYAASMGSSDVVEDAGLGDFFARNLDHFDYVSIRESGQDQELGRKLGFPCEVTLDPTLLLDAEHYKRFVADPPVRERYIYVHWEYGRREDLHRLAAELSEKTGLPVLNNTTGYGSRKYVVFDFPDQVSTGYHFAPGEVVNAIYHADYVISVSFHVVALSIILRKDFYSVVQENFAGNRQRHILGGLGLLPRVVGPKASLGSAAPVTAEQWAHAGRQLMRLRRTSHDYLLKITSGEKRKKEDYLDGGNEFHCYSCAACADACPGGCIEMAENAEGFCFPKTDREACTGCGVCHDACPYNKKGLASGFEQQAYLAYNLDAEEHKNSSSGGMYPLLARHVLDKGGSVAGVRFDSGLNATYDIADTAEGAYAFRYSKYVEPLHNDIYGKTRKALETGRPVLFTGSPCKIAGLKNYLGRDYDNLILVDIICHASTSPVAFRSYLDAKSAAEGSEVVRFAFRTPKLGPCGAKGTETEYGNGRVEACPNDLYMRIFAKSLIYRKSCYLCQYAGRGRTADLTIADFWGHKNYYPDLGTDSVSALMVNSQKGLDVFESVKGGLFHIQVEPGIVFKHNHRAPCGMPQNRTNILNDLIGGKDAIAVFEEALAE